MKGMFLSCSGLTELNLSMFDTSNVTDMLNMFNGCSSLEELDLTSFDTNSVSSYENMFRDCKRLSIVKVSDKWTLDNLGLKDGILQYIG